MGNSQDSPGPPAPGYVNVAELKRRARESSDNRSAPEALKQSTRWFLLHPRDLWAALKDAFDGWNRHNVSRLSAALAYYAVFSLAPVLVISISIAGLVFGRDVAQREIAQEVQSLIGQDSGKAVLAMVQSAQKPATSTLVALIGALLATTYTVAGRGPFVSEIPLPGEGVLEVQVYATAMALTALLIAVLSGAQHRALHAARDWQTRFEAAIGAHRLLAYEWDPTSGRMVITGDSQSLLGVAPQSLQTLADWLALVRGDDRERVNARFELRSRGDGSSDALQYGLSRRDGAALDVTDESRAIRDHDGALHRVVGIVRTAAA